MSSAEDQSLELYTRIHRIAVTCGARVTQALLEKRVAELSPRTETWYIGDKTFEEEIFRNIDKFEHGSLDGHKDDIGLDKVVAASNKDEPEAVKRLSGDHSPSFENVVRKEGLTDIFSPRPTPDECLLLRFPHDGRLVTLDEGQIERVRSYFPTTGNKQGSFGTVYMANVPLQGLGIKIAMKEVRVTHDEVQKMRSITNEKLASRIMHFATVPLLAFSEDQNEGTYCFISPCLESGDLFDGLQKDSARLAQGTSIVFGQRERTRILLHVASGIEYLHTTITDYRGPILHMDIKSANIVLDRNLNARLIDFGLAREMKENDTALPVTSTEIQGTEGYFPTVRFRELTKSHDYHNFGVVIREVLTGINPKVGNVPLRKLVNTEVDDKIQTDIWKDGGISKQLRDLSTKCIDSIKIEGGDENVTAEKIRATIDDIGRVLVEPKWTKNKGNDKCEICMVNPKVSTNLMKDKHADNCSSPIEVCVACMRNSFLNPVKCHSCDKTIVPPIGENWGALFIAGNDFGPKGKDVAKLFKADVRRLKKVFTSKALPVTCIREDNVKMVYPIRPGSEERLQPKITQAFEALKNKKLSTLVFVFSGHRSKEKGFMLGTKDEHLNNKDICEQLSSLQETVSKYIIFLDCCQAEHLESLVLDTAASGLTSLQLNACRSTQGTTLNLRQGSIFINFLIQALTKEKCLNEKLFAKHKCSNCRIEGEFVTIDSLITYITKHMHTYKDLGSYDLSLATPTLDAKNVAMQDMIVGYNYDFEVELEFIICEMKDRTRPEKKLGTIKLKPQEYYNMKTLKGLLFKEFIALKNVHQRSIETFFDIMSIEIDTGPKLEHRKEIDSLERLMAAWNSKRTLRVMPRRTSEIHIGRVGLFLENGNDIFNLLCIVCSNQENKSVIGAVVMDNENTIRNIEDLKVAELAEQLGDFDIEKERLRTGKTYTSFNRFKTELEILHNCLKHNRKVTSVSVSIPQRDGASIDRDMVDMLCFQVIEQHDGT